MLFGLEGAAAYVVLGLVVLLLVAFVVERYPPEVVALAGVSLLLVTGILDTKDVLGVLSNSAPATIAAMFVLSASLVRTGALEAIAGRLAPLTHRGPRWVLLGLAAMIVPASAFINNTPVVVLFIPIVLSLSCAYGFSPSEFLIPLSYASILAGTCTLIGTSTNIIVSDLSAAYGYGSIGMFELSPVGVPIAAIGIALLYFAAPYLMPRHAAPVCELKEGAHRRYLSEIRIPRGSGLIEADPASVFSSRYTSVEVLELIRYSHVFFPERDRVRIAADDLLLVKGSLNDLVALLRDPDITLPEGVQTGNESMDIKDTLIVELILPPQSTLIGSRLMETPLYRDGDIQILAVKRTGLHYTEKKIHDIRLRVGDILLVRCPESKLARIRGGSDFIIVEDVHHEIVDKRKAPLALGIFVGMMAAASLGLADIMVCAITASFLMVLTGCLRIREAYQALQGNVLLLIVGTLALGAAMEKTGATRMYAETFLKLFHGAGPQVVLAGLILLASIGTQILSNNAVAVLLLPIAVSTAAALGVHPKPFIIAVCIGASACFASPIGYKTNLLVYTPGGYRFSDYLKLGIPLNLLVIALGAVLIPVFWGF